MSYYDGGGACALTLFLGIGYNFGRNPSVFVGNSICEPVSLLNSSMSHFYVECYPPVGEQACERADLLVGMC